MHSNESCIFHSNFNLPIDGVFGNLELHSNFCGFLEQMIQVVLVPLHALQYLVLVDFRHQLGNPYKSLYVKMLKIHC